MARIRRIAVAQMGPIQRDEPRQSAVNRLLAMMKQAKSYGAHFVVFPELALTTFFPRWYFEDQADIDAYFETEMPNDATRPLFDYAAETGIGFYLGYAELTQEHGRTRHFNTSILVDGQGRIIGKYRKVHLPGHRDHRPHWPFQHLEKLYFEPGNLGFPVFNGLDGTLGMCICNDRRWPEMYRVLGLQGVELLMLGYNTPRNYPPDVPHAHLQDFHNELVLQSGAYQNGTWIAAAAKAGMEADCELIGGSCIVAPTGEKVVQALSMDDEVIVADCDFDRCSEIKDHVFNFGVHREPESYRLITETKGVVSRNAAE